MNSIGKFTRKLFCTVVGASVLMTSALADIKPNELAFDVIVHDNAEYDVENNLLTNSSFEEGVREDGAEGYSNLADKWQIWDGKASGESSGRIVSDANTGSYALEVKSGTMFCPDYRCGSYNETKSVMYGIMHSVYNRFGTVSGKMIVSFYAKSEGQTSVTCKFRAGGAPLNFDGKTMDVTLETSSNVKILASDEYKKYTVAFNLTGNLKNFSFWDGSKNRRVSDVSSDGIDLSTLNFFTAGMWFQANSTIKFDDFSLEFKPEIYNTFGIQNYAGQKMYMETNIYNNSSSANDALLINAMYDENNSLVSINTKNIVINDTDRVVPVKTEIDVPDNATNQYSVYTYLWHSDGNNKAFADENKAFDVLNSNSSFEILDNGSDVGVLNWSKINSSAQTELVGDSYYGNASMYLKSGANKSGIKQNISDVIDLYGPGRYSFAIKTKSLSDKAQVALSYVSGGNVVNSETFSGESDWKDAEIEFDVSELNESYVYIELINGNGVYIDDAIITKLD